MTQEPLRPSHLKERVQTQNVWFYWVAVNSHSSRMWNRFSRNIKVACFIVLRKEDGLCYQKHMFLSCFCPQLPFFFSYSSSFWSYSRFLTVKKEMVGNRPLCHLFRCSSFHFKLIVMQQGTWTCCLLPLSEPLLWFASFCLYDINSLCWKVSKELWQSVKAIISGSRGIRAGKSLLCLRRF